MHTQIALFEGFDLLDAIGPYEVLTAAGLFAPEPITVELAIAGEPRPVMSGVGLTLAADAALDPAMADVVIVPGAAGPVGDGDAEPVDGSIPMLLGKTLETDLPARLAEALDDPGTVLACVCGGTLIPAMAGLIEGRPAVTHHMGMDLLDATGAGAVCARIVDDGDLVSAGGVTSGIDLGLYLVERFVGPQIAHAVEELFEFERRGVVWHARGPEPRTL